MKITDKMRLDWLSKYPLGVQFDARREMFSYRIGAFCHRWQRTGTLRNALDAAIRADRRSKEKK